jgi:hypothetical protein
MPLEVPVALTHSGPCRQAFTGMHLALLLSVTGQILVNGGHAMKCRIITMLAGG